MTDNRKRLLLIGTLFAFLIAPDLAMTQSATPMIPQKKADPAPQATPAPSPHEGRRGTPADHGLTTGGLGQKLKAVIGSLFEKTQKAFQAGPGQKPPPYQAWVPESVCDFYKLALNKHYGKTDEAFVNLLLAHSYLIAADMTLLNKTDWLSAGTLGAKCKLLDAVYGYEGEVHYKATGEISGKVTDKKSGYKTIEKGLGTSLNPLEVGEYLAVTAFAEESYKCQNMADFGDKCLLSIDALKQMDSQVSPEILLGMQMPQKGGAPSAGGEGCYYKDANMANPFGFCSASNVSEDLSPEEKTGNPTGTASIADGIVVGGSSGSKAECGGVVDCEEGVEDPPGSEFFMPPGMSKICSLNEMAMGGGLKDEAPATPAEPEPAEPAPAEPEASKPKEPVPANPLEDPGCQPCLGVDMNNPHVKPDSMADGAVADYQVYDTDGSVADIPLFESSSDGLLRPNDAGVSLYTELKNNWKEKAQSDQGKGGGGSKGFDPTVDSNAGPCDNFMGKVEKGLDLVCAVLAKEAPIVKSNEDGTPTGFVGTEFYKGNKGEVCNGLIIGKAPVDIIEGGGPGALCCDVSKAGIVWKQDPAVGVTDPTPHESLEDPAKDDGASSQQQLPPDQGGRADPGAGGVPTDPGDPGLP